VLRDNFGQYSGHHEDKAGAPAENPPDLDHKIRDVDDFIIDYIRLLKIKESKK
jgi:hypothetical protein